MIMVTTRSSRIKALCLALLGLVLSCTIAAQSNDQMMSMVKEMLKQFEEFTAEDQEFDDVFQEGAPFKPDLALDNKDLYMDALKDPAGYFRLTEYDNGYALVDEKEIPTNSISLVFNFAPLPGFSYLNAWYEITAVHDGNGKSLLLKEKEMEKYREYGIIEDEFNYPVPGEFSERLWLNRELMFEEELEVQGTIAMEYPGEYRAVHFTAEDAGKSEELGNIQVRLEGIDRNEATLYTKGNRGEMEGLQVMVLNKDGFRFNSISSMAIDAGMYQFLPAPGCAFTGHCTRRILI